MSEKLKDKKERKSIFERGTRFGRNFNLFVGGVALAGAVIAPPALAAGLGVYAAINFAQAGGFELLNKSAKNKKNKKRATKKI